MRPSWIIWDAQVSGNFTAPLDWKIIESIYDDLSTLLVRCDIYNYTKDPSNYNKFDFVGSPDNPERGAMPSPNHPATTI
jgi:hypothetical protein